MGGSMDDRETFLVQMTPEMAQELKDLLAKKFTHALEALTFLRAYCGITLAKLFVKNDWTIQQLLDALFQLTLVEQQSFTVARKEMVNDPSRESETPPQDPG